MTRTTRRLGVAAGAAALTLGLVPALAGSAAASVGAPAPAVPGGLTVARTGGDSTDLAISWRPVTGIDHYTVTVFDGATSRMTTVPAGTTASLFDGSGTCTRYRVRVSAVDGAGATGTTNDYLVAPLAPGAVSALKAERSNDGTTAVLNWAEPANPGLGELKGYRVTVTAPATGKVLASRTSGDTVEKLPALDPDRVYVAKIAAENGFGSCVTGTVLLGNATPTSVSSLTATRDSGVPAQIDLSWKVPAWQGYGPVTSYLVGYGDSRITTWVATKDTRLSLNLDPKVDHVFQVRAVNGDRKGALSPTVKVVRAGVPLTLELDPQVSVDEADGVVTVGFRGPVGSSTTYPRMLVAVRPTIDGTSTFADSQVVHNGTGTAVFTQVPCGVFTVTVTGQGATSKEFGRRVVNRCQDGLVPAERWKLVYGQAKISGNDVIMPNGSETRVMSTLKRSTQDLVLTTKAHLKSGWGYGIWTRASVPASGAGVTGFSVQFDPGYARVSSFGKAILLRQWDNGRECGNPIAKVHFPAGLDEYAAHEFTVVAKGDTLYASVDGTVLFDVPSLTAAVKASGCGMAMPTGTEIGFRTWSAGTSAVFTDTTLS